MRVALVSPYSWTYPGGVTRHIEALAAELDRAGHDIRVLAPFDPDRRRTAVLHRGARPQARKVPEYLVPLGGTIGWASNGAVSNLAGTPSAISTLRRELRAGAFDAVHLHEPVAPGRGGGLGRPPPPRARRPCDRLGRADELRRPAGRHLPLLLGVGAAASRRPPA